MLKINKNSAEIATVPEAPPSTLSKKLIEFVMPTIQTMLMIKSRILLPVGLPNEFVATNTTEIKSPTIF